VDRVLVCDILPNKKHLNQTLKISLSFRYHGDPIDKKYRGEYRVDVINKRKRLVWMHVDRETDCTYQQNIFQSCPEDTLELALLFFSLRGFVDISSIEWHPPEILETPTINTLTYNKDMMNIPTDDRAIKIYADLSRVCELEDTVVEWYEQKYYEYKQDIVDFSFLELLFEIVSVEYSGVDNKVIRLTTRAKNPGYLSKDYFDLGIKIKDFKRSIRNEIKRKGLIKERNVDVELRVGDTFIIYITRSKVAANK